MSFSNVLKKIFKQNGEGPEVKDSILNPLVTIQNWSNSVNYEPYTIVRGGGGVLYYSKLASGPSTPAGSKDPSNPSNIEYWDVFSATGSIPVGTIIWYSTATAPVGYLVCNGQAVSRTLYPDLFEAIGTTYGSGDGSTTFNLPNLLGKFAQGANSNIGDNVDAGLPNIEGSVGWQGHKLFSRATGAFSGVEANYDKYVALDTVSTGVNLKYATFDASLSNSIYGNSNTVQPPAVKLLPCIKAYSDVDNLGDLDAAQLENYVQNNVVHKTGVEVVEGEKTFKNKYSWLSSVNDPNGDHGWMSSIYIQSDTIERYVRPTHAQYSAIVFLDKNHSIDRDYEGRLGLIQYGHTADDANPSISNEMIMRVYDTWSSTASNPRDCANLIVGFTITGIPYATAPSTSIDRTSDYDILTRDWIPKDTRIVHTTTAETIAGVKTFTSEPVVQLNGESMLKLNSVGAGYVFAVGIGNSTNAGLYNETNSKWLYQWASSTGTFTINAVTTGSAKSLVGDTGGTLKWNGQPVQTSSDERLKTPLRDVSSDILDAWNDVQWGEFQYLDAVEEKGENARYHVGLIAQSVDRTFKNRGRDILKYGILCHDEREATEDEEAIDEWQIRYTEALCMEAAYQRRRADRAEARIANLEEEVSSLKLQFSQLINSLK